MAALSEDNYPLTQMLYNRDDRVALTEWAKEQHQLKTNLIEKGPTRAPRRRSSNQSAQPYAVM